MDWSWLVGRIGQSGFGLKFCANGDGLGSQVGGEPAVDGGFESVSEQRSEGGGALSVVVDYGEAHEAAARVDAVVERAVITEAGHFNANVVGLAYF
jgi:hypothetical protein